MQYTLKTPQIGEIGHEVIIVKFHKGVGDYVQKDEPIVTLETNKAALDIESTFAGTVLRILHQEGSKVSTGMDLIVLQRDADNADDLDLNPSNIALKDNELCPVEDKTALYTWLKNVRNSSLSPREKAACRDQKVVPIHLHKDFKNSRASDIAPHHSNEFYEDVLLSKQQTRLMKNLVETQNHIVQGNVQCLCDNSGIDLYRRRLRESFQVSLIPSRLEIISWGVIAAMKQHPIFCSRLMGTNTLRQFKNPNLGVAVALKDDELAIAIIPNAFSYSFEQFLRQFRGSLNEAKNDNHITTFHPVVISDLSTQGIVNAVPVVSHPACATLFIGCPLKFDRKSFFLSLSFDHRFINGAGASGFLKDVQSNIKKVIE
jgi:pyruvate/2-oxoglutarate dehydrogenase complex dihydrolipoamide acyltransferase (E2) component